MRGRKPVPTELKILHGNPGHRPLNEFEPKPDVEIPECPEHLDAEAKAEWGRIAPELAALGILTRIDRAALAGYCQAWSRWVYAEQQLAKFGVIVKSGGALAQSPYLPISNKALENMRKFLAEFGMTPSSRSRVKTAEPKDEDGFDSFLSKANRPGKN